MDLVDELTNAVMNEISETYRSYFCEYGDGDEDKFMAETKLHIKRMIEEIVHRFLSTILKPT